jgi:hypothetical protein
VSFFSPFAYLLLPPLPPPPSPLVSCGKSGRYGSELGHHHDSHRIFGLRLRRNGALPAARLSGRTVRGVRSNQRRMLTGCWMDRSRFYPPVRASLLLDERSFLPIWSLRHGILRVPKLAAPQHVSGFGVCLDLHRNAPFLEFLPSCFTSGDSNSMKPLKLAAPHRASSFRVRLDLHRIAPSF